ncbi:MAG TPA: RNA 2',3'-cyclic phosphodiesterase [Bacillota bacterium]|nr:RNA 2',3'-cyclic phosphodiesterase [Bacillota bacterium]HPJ24188.1 RNA 2',3'-cyclic phosphodiesterase [Bacillota bacterium]
MRIFIALLFDEPVKNKIWDMLNEVEEIAEKGNYSRYENLHLTLLYLGETSQEMLGKIIAKLKEIKFKKFSYQTGHLDFFKKAKTKKIVYLSVNRSMTLESLQHLVCVKLKELNIDFHSEKYTPHITFGREVSLISDDDLQMVKTVPLEILADRISIMESTRIDGQLTYIELDNVPLN